MIAGLSYIYISFASELSEDRAAVTFRSRGEFKDVCVTRNRVVSGSAGACALDRRYRRL